MGTAMYQPASPGLAGPALDIYALGIIAFELLQRFETRMERMHCIQQLKQGDFPTTFLDSALTEEAAQAMKCISAMLSQEKQTVSVAELKKMLSAIPNSDG